MYPSLLILSVLLTLVIFAWPRLGWHAYSALMMCEAAFMYALPRLVRRWQDSPKATSPSGLVPMVW